MPSVRSSRRALLLATPGLALSLRAAAQPGAPAAMDALRAEWTAFREAFVSSEGRVVDTGNNNISHSEGQGWALLTAVRADDRPSFDRLLGWTLRVLRRPGDHLLSWRYRPGAANPVDDPNNATDGDLFVAMALLEAAERWGDGGLHALALSMGRDILRLLVRQAGPYTVMLPGARHFEQLNHTVVNPSYYAFPALRSLAIALPDPAWLRVAADGVALLRLARFGQWRLPPDWLAIQRADGALSLPSNWAPRFSYDAVRVPLYMVWVRLAEEPAVRAAAAFWTEPGHRHLPAWTNLNTNAISPYAASSGVAAVARLVVPAARDSLFRMAPAGVRARDYYSGALNLLAMLATRDLGMT